MVNGLLTLNTSDIEFERKGQIDITIPLNMITECYLEMRRKPLVKIRTDYRIYTLCFMAYGGGAIGKNKAFVKLLHNQGSSGTSTGMSASTIPKLKVNTRPLEPEANKAYEIVGLVLAIVAALLKYDGKWFCGLDIHRNTYLQYNLVCRIYFPHMETSLGTIYCVCISCFSCSHASTDNEHRICSY